jgi:RNA polymerase sigma factor (sigma-70 family)
LRRRRIARFFAGRPRGEVDSQVVDEDSRGGVERALAALSPGLRAVALLRLYARLSPEEIGSILGTSSATVSSRLHAATEVMTAALAGGHAPEAAEPR